LFLSKDTLFPSTYQIMMDKTLVYSSVGLLVFLVAFAFWFTPLGHAERYVPEAEAAQGG